jgi:hypothetical protein
MSFETQEADARLDTAIAELRDSRIDEYKLGNAQAQVLRRFRRQRVWRSTTSVFAAASVLAAIFTGVAIMMPSKSLAAEVERIALNGDQGMRHIVQYHMLPNGTLKKGAEYFATDNQARMVFSEPNEQIVVRRDSVTYFHPDGATMIQHTESRSMSRPQLLEWMRSSAKSVVEMTQGGHPASVSLDHGVVVNGRTVDRYTLDSDFRAWNGQSRHSHVVLLADPQTQKPIQEETTVTGMPKRVMTWDFPAADPSLVEGPKVDPKRLYDIDQEQQQILSAMSAEGQTRTVEGHKVNLKALIISEQGAAVAIVRCDYAIPGNYAVRINGIVAGDAAQTEAESKRYARTKPHLYQGIPYEIVWGTRSYGKPSIHWPDRVKVEVPIIDGQRLVGYAAFDNIPTIRTYRETPVLKPTVGFFWEHRKLDENAIGTATAVMG